MRPVERSRSIASRPIAATLERASATTAGEERLHFSARLGVPEDRGWISVSELAENRELLEEIMDRAGREYGSDNRPFTGTALLRGYLWRMLTPAVGVFLAERRLPDLRAENVALRFGGGGSAEDVAFTGARFAVLSGDPDAAHPDAVIVSSEGELLRWLHDALVETHLPALIPALKSLRVRRGSRALRRVFADSCAEAFTFVGRELGMEAEARGFAEVLLSGPSPLSAPTNFYALEYPGGSEWTRVRNTCCLYYETGNGTCFTCPRKTDKERISQILEEKAETLEVEEA